MKQVYQSTHTGQQVDKAIDYMLDHEQKVQDGLDALDAKAEEKLQSLEGVSQAESVSYDNTETTTFGSNYSALTNVDNVQDAIDAIGKKGLRSIEKIYQNGKYVLRQNKLDGDTKDDILLTADSISYDSTQSSSDETTPTNVQSAIRNAVGKVEELSQQISSVHHTITKSNMGDYSIGYASYSDYTLITTPYKVCQGAIIKNTSSPLISGQEYKTKILFCETENGTYATKASGKNCQWTADSEGYIKLQHYYYAEDSTKSGLNFSIEFDEKGELLEDIDNVKTQISSLENIPNETNSLKNKLFNLVDNPKQKEFGCYPFNKVGKDEYSIILLYGQSLSIGTDSKKMTNEVLPNCYMFSNGNMVALNMTNEAPVVGCVNALASVYGCKLVGASQGQGDQSIENLSKGTNLYTTKITNYLTNIKSWADTNNVKVSVSAIVWMQGEANNSVSTETYQTKLQTLKDDLETDIKAILGQPDTPLFLMYQMYYAQYNTGGAMICQAYKNIEDANVNAIVASPVFFMPNYGVHHLSANGYRWFGEYCAKAIIRANRDGIKQHIAPISIKASGKVIDVEYKVFTPPLVYDNDLHVGSTYNGAVKGVRIQDRIDTNGLFTNATKVAISSVEVVNGRILRITLASSMTSGKTYYLDTSMGGSFHDSDEWLSRYMYENTDADQKNGSTTMPSNQPKDADGNVLNNVRYPMYNWIPQNVIQFTAI